MKLKSVFSFKFLRAFLHLFFFFFLKRAYKSGLMAELSRASQADIVCVCGGSVHPPLAIVLASEMLTIMEGIQQQKKIKVTRNR